MPLASQRADTIHEIRPISLVQSLQCRQEHQRCTITMVSQIADAGEHSVLKGFRHTVLAIVPSANVLRSRLSMSLLISSWSLSCGLPANSNAGRRLQHPTHTWNDRRTRLDHVYPLAERVRTSDILQRLIAIQAPEAMLAESVLPWLRLRS